MKELWKYLWKKYSLERQLAHLSREMSVLRALEGRRKEEACLCALDSRVAEIHLEIQALPLAMRSSHHQRSDHETTAAAQRELPLEQR